MTADCFKCKVELRPAETEEMTATEAVRGFVTKAHMRFLNWRCPSCHQVRAVSQR
jgi:uncharacterized protein with PIN domain